jgi:uncharacterized protein involved in response to NO
MNPMNLPVVGQLTSPEISSLRRDPYRLFFPLGILLGWVGVGQWLWFSLGLGGQYRVVFHAMVQVQGFLACFVAGFLFTFIPKRTATPPPAAWQLAVAAVCPVLLAAFAWNDRWASAQACWLIEVVVLLHFVISRASSSRNKSPAPPSLIWIPLALVLGVAGAMLSSFPAGHGLGRLLVLEGVVGALVMGIGAMLVPVITCAQPPAAGAARWPQLLLAVVFVGSFVLQSEAALAPRWAYALRLLVVGWVLVRGAQLWKRPTQPGLNRWVVLAAAWGLPVGYALLTIWPEYRAAGLHVVFLGGFGLLALAVGQHVTVAHSGRGEWLAAWPKATWAMAALTALAIVARAAMQLDPGRSLQWMTAAALAFIAAGACWLWGMAPLLLELKPRAR